MRYWLLHPDARLRPAICCYFVVDAGHSPYFRNELLLPDEYAEIVFAFDAGFERWDVGKQTARTVMNRSYVIGGRSHSVFTGSVKRLRLVGVKLDPRMLRRMIMAPLGEFRDSILTLRDLNNTALLSLEHAVAECKSVAQIANTLNRFFLRQLSGASAHDEAVDYVLQRIRTERGMGSITSLTRELGIDARTLERRFLAWLGMTPKKYARILRFKHSYHRLIAYPHQRASGLHLEGYYDQSHFNKEFKYFTGVAPSTLFASRTPFSTAVTDHLVRGTL
jgi:AraC-like DNA-binding protein